MNVDLLQVILTFLCLHFANLLIEDLIIAQYSLHLYQIFVKLKHSINLYLGYNIRWSFPPCFIHDIIQCYLFNIFNVSQRL